MKKGALRMNEYSRKALVFKAFCDENRLRIMEQLKQSEQCACHLLESLPISQSTLSHHMKILIESGVVTQRKEGKWVYYSLSSDGVKAASNFLREITEIADDYKKGCSC
jgi:ArsR family transcriptional regulator